MKEVHITLYDLGKCMVSIVKMYKNSSNISSKVSIVHPGYKRTMLKFEYDRDTKNVKLLSDVAIVLKY